jgi:hypothetical protein
MKLIDLPKEEAMRRGLLDLNAEIDAATAFTLVRDMPYRRASDRRPETIITEWRGTCSGKHYLLQALFAELGLAAQVIACTTITPVEPEQVPESHRALYEAANRRFVDVHNYLRVDLPDGERMIVDATWPLASGKHGRVVNASFVLGEDQQIASEPLESWLIPPGSDAQAFKEELLKRSFTPAELEFREEVIRVLSEEE